METIAEIAMLNIIIVYIIDISGIVGELQDVIKKNIPKPFSCSACSSLWITLGYMIFLKKAIILSLFASVISAIFAPVTFLLLTKLSDFIYKKI